MYTYMYIDQERDAIRLPARVLVLQILVLIVVSYHNCQY